MTQEEAFYIEVMFTELAHARAKFPKQTRETTLLALVEEVGELAKAHIEKRPENELRGEAIQAMVMALRVIVDTKP
jgi:NTP pyrophosphatase (non-canonical NTP hydrolase)